jgi:hypothetical protein
MNRQLQLLLSGVLACGVLLPALAYAGVDTAWVRRYDGPAHSDDWATCLAVDSIGNVYVAGPSFSDTGSMQYLDFATIKYYPNGDTAWVRREDFGGKDLPSGLGVDAQGNVYVTGTNNDSRMVTVKYGPTGNLLWYRFFGSQGGANDLVLDSHGNIAVCGGSYRASSDAATVKYRPNGDTAWARFYDLAGLEDYAQAAGVSQTEGVAMSGFGAGAASHYDCITVMYDSSGGRLWAAVYDGPNHGDDRSFDMAVSSGGNLVTTGHTDHGYGTPPDYLTIMYSPQGETIWTRTYDGPAHDWDEASAVVVDSVGNVYVTGFSTGDTSGYDYATMKYTPSGQQAWVARYDGPGHDYDRARAIAVDARGNSYVTGGAWVNQAHGGDVATIKYSPGGESLWCVLYNGPGNWTDEGDAVAVDDGGVVYVAGQSNGVGTGSDIVTIKYVQNGGVAEGRATPVASRPSLAAQPSVFRTVTSVHFSPGSTTTARVLVFDVAGRCVRTLVSGDFGVRTIAWDGRNDRGTRLPSGVYEVVLEAGEERTQVKVVMSE